MHFFKLTLRLFGLEAPIFSWLVSFGLILFSAYILYRHWKYSKQHGEAFHKITKSVQDLIAENPRKPGDGVSLKVFDTLHQYFEPLASLKPVWRKIESNMIRRPGRGGGDEYWIGESVDDALVHTEVVDTHWLKSAPGIITGIGLLATFLAILIALLDVRLINNRVQGLDLLIQGLSGKFLSSVVALSCAVVFLFIERWVSNPANLEFSSLVQSLSDSVPRITPVQILSDLHKDISEQSNAFRLFNADLSLKLKQSFGESVNPTLDRMVTAIDDLNALLRAAEAEKHKSMTEQLGGLLKNFEQSIQVALQKLGTQFNATLTGNAQTQFEKVTESLGSTASLLKEMNSQFTVNQAVLTDLISLAKNTTSDQMNQGQAQIQELASVLKELMIQLQEKTGESLGSVQQTLAAVTIDISNKVADLSVQMASIIEETTDKSTRTAKQIIEEAGTLSSRSADQLAKLLEKHGAEVARVEDLSLLLDTTIKNFFNALGKYDQIAGDLKRVTGEMGLSVTSMTAASKSIKDSQEEAAKVARYAADQVNTLKTFIQGQKDTWDRIQSSMAEYRNVFGIVDGRAKELLNDIGKYLQDYSEITQGHFGKLGALANEHIDNAVKRISGSIEDLSMQLDELQSIMAGITKYSKRLVQ